MVGGNSASRRSLPGITRNLIEAGADQLSWTNDVAVHTLAGWCRQFPSVLVSCFMSLGTYSITRCGVPSPRCPVSGPFMATRSWRWRAGKGAVVGVQCRVRGAQESEKRRSCPWWWCSSR